MPRRINADPDPGLVELTDLLAGTWRVTGPGIDIRGVWEIDDGRICRKGADGKRNCVDYVRLGPNRFRNSGGIEFCIGPRP